MIAIAVVTTIPNQIHRFLMLQPTDSKISVPLYSTQGHCGMCWFAGLNVLVLTFEILVYGIEDLGALPPTPPSPGGMGETYFAHAKRVIYKVCKA